MGRPGSRRARRWTRRTLTGAGVVLSAFGLVLVAYEIAASPPASTARPPSGALKRLIVAGDTQQMPPLDWIAAGGGKERRQIAAEIESLQPDLVLHAGDVVGLGLHKPFWNQFRQEFRGLPVWPVLGNHDLMGPNSRALGFYFDTFPHLDHRRWYALRAPPLACLMLDSNLDDLGETETRRQVGWLAEQLDAAEADREIRAVLLVTHHPPFSVHREGGWPRIRELFWTPAARRSKFLAFFSGHHHNFQYIRVGSRHAFVTGGGGAPLWWMERASLPPGAELVASKKSHHLLDVQVEPAGLRVTRRDLQPGGDWAPEFSAVLAWPRPPDDAPRPAAPAAPSASILGTGAGPERLERP